MHTHAAEYRTQCITIKSEMMYRTEQHSSSSRKVSVQQIRKSVATFGALRHKMRISLPDLLYLPHLAKRYEAIRREICRNTQCWY